MAEHVADALRDRRALRAAAALLAIMVASSAMNIAVFPSFDSLFTAARDISVIAAAGCMLSIGLVATFRPSALHIRFWNAAAAAMYLAGAIGLPVSLACRSAALLTVCACLMSLARTWASMVVGLALMRLPGDRALAAIASAFVLCPLAEAALWALPTYVGFACFCLLPACAFALAWGDARGLALASEAGDAPADVAVTQPASFIPLGNRFFWFLLLFRVAFGFSLRTGFSPASALIAAAPVAALAACVLLWRRPRPDTMVRLSVLTVVAGFLLGFHGEGVAGAPATAALSAGNMLFDMVAWRVLVAAGARNERAALAILSWGRGMTALGSVIGAGLGVAAVRAADPGTAPVVSSLLVFLTVAAALLLLDRDGFARAIDGVAPVVEEAPDLPEPDLGARCDKIASERGLTRREAEVFGMLARGRDRAYIEGELTVSRNTVKAHVKHIYAKLGVHSHQELLDLVEDVG